MSDLTTDIETLREWIGREQTLTDTIDPVAVHRMELTLDREPRLAIGDPLPPVWHPLTFIEAAPHSGLGPDGHPARGGFLPPVALPRRMWAGSRLTYDAPLRIGAHATKTSTIEDVVVKEGGSGTLCFVTIEHRVHADGAHCFTEAQDLVYRDDPAPGAARPTPKPAPDDADHSETITPSEVQLFRYSALTFNGHRIHYDRRYANEVEGYDGLVVHGPLTASLLADLAVRVGGELTTFSFRGVSPLIDTAPFTIHARTEDDGTRLWAANPTGGLAMTATATPHTMIQRCFVNLLVTDPPGAARWFIDLLGWEIAFASDWFVHLRAPDAEGIELGLLRGDHEIVPSDARGTGGAMVTVVVPDVDAVHDAAVERGDDVIEAPRDLFYGQRRCVVRGPEGHVIDISSECDPDPVWLASLGAD